MRDNGGTIKWMDTEISTGLMGEGTKELISMTKSKALGCSSGKLLIISQARWTTI